MRRIIEGKSYDTETAELIYRVDEEHESSQSWWSLYRTTQGAYFEVAAGHDGVVDTFRPVTDGEARTLVERFANGRVEELFGAAPEAGPPRRHYPHEFSRRTVLAALDVLQRLRQAAFSRFLRELGPGFGGKVGDEAPGNSLTKRLNTLMSLYDEQPDRPIDGEETIADVIIDKAVTLLTPPPDPDWGEPPELPEVEQIFIRRLAADGYTVVDRKLRSALPADIGLPTVQDELRGLLERHQMRTALGHLDQALDGHARAKWATANSQLRSFFEGMLDEMAVRFDSHIRPDERKSPRETGEYRLPRH
jgi:hypothetical protein